MKRFFNGPFVASLLLLNCAIYAGNPILLVTDQSYKNNVFGGYLAEIMRSEGIVQFDHTDRSTIQKATDLAPYQLVVMAQMNFQKGQEDLLRQYVRDGGRLITMRPDPDLADLFGISVKNSSAGVSGYYGVVRSEKLLQYFTVDANTPWCAGIEALALQYHGDAIYYSLNGAKACAFLNYDSSTLSPDPAITVNSYGKGYAVAYAFDLAKSVVLTRQGNPDWINSEGDGLPEIRPGDLFMRMDGRKYFDIDRLHTPQADESQRIFANLVMRLVSKPLPRMWYLPQKHKVVLVSTGDTDPSDGDEIGLVFRACENYGGRFTAYMHSLGVPATTIEQETSWRAAGHEVGVHAWGGGPEGAGAYDAIYKGFEDLEMAFRNKFGHGSRTTRNHSLDWTGWVDVPAVLSSFGVKLDTTCCHWLPSDSPLRATGYSYGTGLPQLYINEHGEVLPIYQAVTQWSDDWFTYHLLTGEQCVQVIRDMFERAVDKGYYSSFVINIHQCRYTGSCTSELSNWVDHVWSYCRDKNIPMWSAEMLLDFIEARNSVQFSSMQWDNDTSKNEWQLTFEFNAPAGHEDLTIMVPASWENKKVKTIKANGQKVSFTIDQVKGIQYAVFAAPADKATMSVAF